MGRPMEGGNGTGTDEERTTGQETLQVRKMIQAYDWW